MSRAPVGQQLRPRSSFMYRKYELILRDGDLSSLLHALCLRHITCLHKYHIFISCSHAGIYILLHDVIVCFCWYVFLFRVVVVCSFGGYLDLYGWATSIVRSFFPAYPFSSPSSPPCILFFTLFSSFLPFCITSWAYCLLICIFLLPGRLLWLFWWVY